MKKTIALNFLFITIISFGQNKEVNSGKTLSDIKTIEIGTQNWMSKNLNFANF